MTATPLLEVSGLGKSFGGLRAVSDLSFRVSSREVLGIIGPNGAGKTTAVNLISGVIKPDSGQIKFLGEPVRGFKPHRLAERGLVRTFQATTVYPEQTSKENCLRAAYFELYTGFFSCLFSTRLARAKREEVESQIDETLDLLELSRFADQKAGSLPYGYQKMIGFALALLARPKLILLDEPAAGLSAEETDRVKDAIKLIHGRGIAVAVIDHNMRFMADLCKHIIVMQQGKKIAEGEPAAVLADPVVISAYLGRQHARARN
jgi:branched-chain amino acid transport system ATP-binding protein